MRREKREEAVVKKVKEREFGKSITLRIKQAIAGNVGKIVVAGSENVYAFLPSYG